MQNFPSCTEMTPRALLNLLTWLKIPFLQSSGQIPLNPSRSCSPTAQAGSEMRFHRQDSFHRKGTEPWPSSPLCHTNKPGKDFFVVVAEGWFRAQGLCTTEAENKSFVFAEQPDVPGEMMAPKILTHGLERAFLFLFPALQNSSYQLCYPVLAESSVLGKEMMWGAIGLEEQRT